MTISRTKPQVAQATTRSNLPSGGGSIMPDGWYADASGGFFSEDNWTPRFAAQVFPRITSSSRIDHIATQSVARQVRVLRAALSVNNSELARILGVSRPTICNWLDGGVPNAGNRTRIRTLMRLLSGSGVSANNPLFPRFVRGPLDPGDEVLFNLLCEETIDESTAKDLIRRAKALGDAMDAERKERKTRLREAGFEDPDNEQRRANLATNVALMEWPRE